MNGNSSGICTCASLSVIRGAPDQRVTFWGERRPQACATRVLAVDGDRQALRLGDGLTAARRASRRGRAMAVISRGAVRAVVLVVVMLAGTNACGGERAPSDGSVAQTTVDVVEPAVAPGAATPREPAVAQGVALPLDPAVGPGVGTPPDGRAPAEAFAAWRTWSVGLRSRGTTGSSRTEPWCCCASRPRRGCERRRLVRAGRADGVRDRPSRRRTVVGAGARMRAARGASDDGVGGIRWSRAGSNGERRPCDAWTPVREDGRRSVAVGFTG